MSGRGVDAETVDLRPVMGPHRATTTEEAPAQTTQRTIAIGRSSGARRHTLCAALRHSLGDVTQGDGLRFRDDVLAAIEILAASWGMAPAAPSAPVGVARGRAPGLLPCHCRQFFDTRRGRGKKTGPNPTDRRRAGSKHHLLTDAQGVPLTAILTGANDHDVTQLLPLVEEIPAVAGKIGAPKRKPALVQADRAYDSNPHRQALAAQGIRTEIARRRTKHGSGLGVTRWVVERTISWLHQFRRLRIRFERRPEIHEAFLKLGCCLICWRFLRAA